MSSPTSPTRRPSTRLFAEVREALGGLDVLVNNVGVAGPTAAVDEMDPERVRRVRAHQPRIDVPVHPLAVPMLRELPGSIVNISSSAGIFGYPLRSPYAAAKWGVVGLTKTWAMELGSAGIRVNAHLPRLGRRLTDGRRHRT